MSIKDTLRSLTPARIVSSFKKPFTKKVAWWAAGILGLYTIVGFLVLPPVAKHVALKELPKALHREVSIDSIRFNPFTLALRVSGFGVKEKESAELFAGFDELLVDFQLASIFRRAPVLREVRLRAPKVKIVRNQDGSYNFSDLVGQPSPKPPKTGPQGAPPRFSLNNIQIIDGQVDFDDRPAAARHEVREINVAVPFLSNFPYAVDTYIDPSFRAVVDGSPVVLAGKTKPFEDSLESTVEIDIDHLDLPRYLAYVPAKLRFKIPSGLLDTKLTASFMRRKDKAPTLTLAGRVTLEKFALTELDDRPLLTLPLVAVRVDAAEVFARKFQIGYVLVQDPELQVRRDRSGKINLLSVVPEDEARKSTSATGEAAASEKKGAFDLELAELKVADATIRVSDEMPGKAFRTDIEVLNLTVSRFSFPQSKPAAVALDFRTSAGESFRHAGTVLMDPLSAEGTVELSNLRIPAYAPYYGPFILFDVKDGLFNLSTRYNVAKTPEGLGATISGLQASVSSLQLRKQGERTDFVSIPETAVRNGELDLGKRTVVVEEFLTKNGAIAVRREKDGSIDLTKLVAPTGPMTEEAPQSGETSPWIFTVKKATVDRYGVSFTDETPTDPVKVQAEPIQVVVENLSNQKESKAQASLRITVNRKGTVAVDGAVGLNPLVTDLRLDVQRLDLVPLQPYVTDKVKIVVSSGELRVKGRLGVKAAVDGPPQISFSGQTNLGNFVSLDRATSEDFLKWKSLFAGGIQANVNPLRVEINEVALSDFYSRLIVYPKGTLNLREMLAGGEAQPASAGGAGAAGGGQSPATAPAKKEPAPRSPAEGPPFIAIGRIVLQGGNVNFTDLFIKPNYSANLTDLGGSVTGLSSQPGTTADLDIFGRLNRSAPLEIKGKVNPLTTNPYLDLKADVKDIELEPFTPYSGKYAGYAIEKGKLSFKVDYKIENRKLKAENRLILDQLTFGEKVESPTATKLPVLLAVALLKDRNGVIDLNLPIGGSLDDPHFSVGSVILQVLVNLIAKAATSPFALLGAAFGGGEELSYVEFQPGLATLDDAAIDKLSKVGKALNDRPGLKLDISGRADPVADREGLKHYVLERLVKVQKLKDLIRKGEAAPSLDKVTVEPSEYEQYLTRAYKEAKFPKPRNFIGLVKDLPVPEMEKLIITNTEINDEDLLQLASERAATAQDYLISTAQVPADRVFLVSPKIEAGKGGEKGSGSRVEFSLK